MIGVLSRSEILKKLLHEVRSISAYSSYTNLSKLSDHIFSLQSHLGANPKCLRSISASLGIVSDTPNRNGYFKTEPTSPTYSQNNIVPLRPTLRANPLRPTLRSNQKYPTSVSACLGNVRDTRFKICQNHSHTNNRYHGTELISEFSSRYVQNNWLMNSGFHTVGLSTCANGVSSFRAYSSSASSIVDGSVPLPLVFVLDSYPYLSNVVIPVCWTVTATLFAWLIMPEVFRQLHKYSVQGPAALLFENLPQKQIAYEKGFWSSLEDPVQCLIAFMAFSQLGGMIAPSNFAYQYIAQGWSGATILSLIWFFHRWKTNEFTRALLSENIVWYHHERIGLEKLSSVGLFVFGLMTFSQACGVAAQSVLTVSVIGGVATAFAEDAFSRFTIHCLKPFYVGDTIKIGCIRGEVVNIGLTYTGLRNNEIGYAIIPNSVFSCAEIVNLSRFALRDMKLKFPIQIDDLEKIAQILDDMKSTVKSRPEIFVGNEVLFFSVGNEVGIKGLSVAVMTIECKFKTPLMESEFRFVEAHIFCAAVRVIEDNGGMVPYWKSQHKGCFLNT